MTSNAGRRRHQRVRSKSLVALVCVDPEFECPVGDASPGGLFLRTDRLLPLGTALPLELRRADRRSFVRLAGWVIRQVEASAGTEAGLGVVFDALSSSTETELARLLALEGQPEAAPPPLPALPRRASVETAPPIPEVPPLGERPEGDPFRERPEPRMPRSGMPDEKVEYFRGVLILKNEALTRGRALYGHRVAEADRLHDLATGLRRQLEVAAAQVEQGRATARELGELKAHVAQLETDLTAKQSVVDIVLGSRADLERQVERLYTELAESREATRNLQAALEAAVANARRTQDGLEARVTDADRALASEREERMATEAKLAKLEALELGSRKIRDELAAANRKAMEAQGTLNKERRQREEMEEAVTRLTTERDKLRADQASLKKKLMSAEDALEAAAAARSKPRKPGAKA